jgi:hypothetical protein
MVTRYIRDAENLSVRRAATGNALEVGTKDSRVTGVCGGKSLASDYSLIHPQRWYMAGPQ